MRPPVSKETAGDWPRRFLKPRGERGGRSGLSGGGGGEWPRGGGRTGLSGEGTGLAAAGSGPRDSPPPPSQGCAAMKGRCRDGCRGGAGAPDTACQVGAGRLKGGSGRGERMEAVGGEEREGKTTAKDSSGAGPGPKEVSVQR